MEVQILVKAVASVALVGMLGLVFRLYRELVGNPEKLRSALRKQGIGGPPPTLLLGNVLEIKKARTAKPPPAPTGAPTHHNCANALFPFFEPWQNKYDVWNNMIEAKCGMADIKMDQHMRSVSGDVISKACFWSNYSKGEDIFVKLRALQECASKEGFSFGIPFMKYLPTKSNREAWALEKDLRTLILKVVKERNESGYEMDLLQTVLEGAKNSEVSPDAIDRFIVDNCKNIYLADFETTAVAATWCLMLLAANPEWQERIRAEVLGVCDGQVPDSDMIRKMKLLSMVINESLRLYPPVAMISREVFKEMKLGDVHVPKGVNIWAFVLTLHTDPEVWGADSYQFNPQRFANGITGACKLPHLYVPFGVGPRVCLGQYLALLELKILLPLILSNFSFTLSPAYIHSPSLNLIIEPEHGVDLNVKKL